MIANQFFDDCNSWKDFQNKLITLNKKEKGNAFEVLTKLYFKINPVYSFYDAIWLLNEVPQTIIEELGIPSHDLGIDLIAKHGDEFHAIQCKFHTEINSSVSFKEVATFISLLEGNKKFTQGYICSSANITSRNLDKIETKPITSLLADTWQNLDAAFFDQVRKFLAKKKYAPVAYQPKAHQVQALNDAVNYFVKENNKRGKLIFPCGAGKSLTGYWLTQKLKSKATLIAVPSLSLVKQTLDVYLREIVAEGKKVKWLCICSDEGIGSEEDIVFKTENLGVPCQTNPEYIKKWLKENQDEDFVIFTTYQSGRIIAEISKEFNFTFDVGIFDEAHKTVGSTKKLFSHLLFDENISIDKRIFLTATERFYAGSKDEIISMDDEEIYGDIFTQMSFKDAIELGLLTDYKVITIDVQKSEIADFIQQNNLVQLDDKWKKETEARSLASMLALRKAMKLFPIKNAVSFHSSIEKATRNKELQTYITDTYHYAPIDTFTVSGKIPTTKRNVVIQEFANSPQALITNARCLTEGVDVPNIDCIVFSDPRKSKVDIVQALGRALRKKEGKDWGYVILPVVYDDATQEIDNENFNEILAIVRGLAANDDRIIEYFKDKKETTKQPKEPKSAQFQFEVFSDYVDANLLASQLQVKLWEKLSRFQWMPFEEAREYVRKLNLKSKNEYLKLWRENKLPNNFPAKPEITYKYLGFISIPDFLGYDTKFQEWMTFEDAKIFIRSLKLKNEKEWKDYTKTKNRDKRIPVAPAQVYKYSGFVSMPDFLGYNSKFQDWLSYEEALSYVHSLNLQSVTEWRDYTKTEKYNVKIPKAPNNFYKNKGWKSFVEWLGTYEMADQFKKYKNYNECKDELKKFDLKSQKDFNVFKKSKFFPKDIPKEPSIKFKKNNTWKGWPDFLSYQLIRKGIYLSYYDAQLFVQKLELKNRNEWKKYCDSGKLPNNIPKTPSNTYEGKGWVSFGEWLGTGKIASQNMEYLSFLEARNWSRSLQFKKYEDWLNYKKSNSLPNNIPRSPDVVYKELGWINWGDFLGYHPMEKIGLRLSFTEAKEFVKVLNLKGKNEWFIYSKSGNKPQNIPSAVNTVYKSEWKGWADFLGKEEK